MKLLAIILSCMLFLNNVDASITENKNDITSYAVIKYKWFKEEVVEGKYHKKGEILSEYIEDSYNIAYGDYTDWNPKYCEYSKEFYLIESKVDRRRYKMVRPIKYIILENLETDDEIKVFYQKQELKYTKQELSSNKIILNLDEKYDVDKLWFYINTDIPYKITLTAYNNIDLPSLSKEVTSSFILFPDETWIQKTNIYVDIYTSSNLEENVFTELIEEHNTCRVREIQTYRYKTNKIYYDDNYYEYIEGYIPDYSDYIIEYIKELPTNTIEITKTETKTVDKYIYLEVPNANKINQEELQSSELIPEFNSENSNESKETNIEKIKYIDKKIYKVPKKIYIAIILLFLIIIIQTIKLLKMKLNKTFH